MVGVTTVVVIQPDWTRTLLTPLRALAWRAYLYFVLVSVLAVAGVAFVFFAGLGSGLLMATLVGIPLLALVVMSGRAWNRLYRSLARLIGVTIDAPPPFVRPPGRLHTRGRDDRCSRLAQPRIPGAACAFDDADRIRGARRGGGVRRVGRFAGGVVGDR